MQDWIRNLGWVLFGVALTVTTDGFGLFVRAGSAPVEQAPGGGQPPEAPEEGTPPPRATVSAAKAELDAAPPRPPAVNAQTLAQLQAQLTELERLLAARRAAPDQTAAPPNTPQPPPALGSKLEGDLAELMARQDGITQGTQSEREREIDRVAEERAIRAVSDIRKLISAHEVARQRQMERIIKESQ